MSIFYTGVSSDPEVVVVEHLASIIKLKFDSTVADAIIPSLRDTPEWLKKMMSDSTLRMTLIELHDQNRNSTLIKTALKEICKMGHHRYVPALHYAILHYIALHCTTLHYTSLLCTVVHHTMLHCAALYTILITVHFYVRNLFTRFPVLFEELIVIIASITLTYSFHLYPVPLIHLRHSYHPLTSLTSSTYVTHIVHIRHSSHPLMSLVKSSSLFTPRAVPSY